MFNFVGPGYCQWKNIHTIGYTPEQHHEMKNLYIMKPNKIDNES